MIPAGLGLVILLVSLIYWVTRRSRYLPPGPAPFPLLGNLIQMGLLDRRRPYVALDQMSKVYGDVMTVRLGMADTVVLSSYESMRDTLHSAEWSGRIWSEAFQARSLNQRLGIIFLEGPAWREQRRFLIRHLRDVGFGKQAAMELLIQDELEELMERLEGLMGDGEQTVLYMHNYFNLSVINVLWTLIAGTRYCHDDPRLKDLLSMVDYLFKSGSIGGLSSAFPILRRVVPGLVGEHLQMKAYKELQDFIRDSIREHRKSKSYGDSHDFLDIFLQETDKTKDDPDTFFKEDQLVMLCLDLFLAGSETTSNTLGFAILFMILHPKVQDRVYKELETVIGTERRPTLGDQLDLKYTTAVLMEVQRLSNVVPFAPPHQLTEDVDFRGHRIPKNTPVMLNLYSVHMMRAHWGDPEEFRPDRFLDDEGSLVKDDHLIPFGLGKRNCIGETLARTSLALYFTTILQRFRFESVPGHLGPSCESAVGYTLSPQPYNALVTLRHKPES